MSNLRRYFAQLILIGLFLQPDICGAEWSKEDRLQEKQQLDLWQKKLSEINNLHGENKIEELSLGLRSMAFRKEFGDRDPRTDSLYSEIQSALLAIPGHAEYYRDRILKAQEEFRSKGGNKEWSAYRDETGNGFQILPLLPSPEGVRVLGELFSNDWVPPENETAPLSEKFGPLSVSARVALQKFPLLDKPFSDPITRQNVSDAQAAWQQWYEQVKAGNRTFRFEGDPTEYGPDGPASKELVQRVERDRKRDGERAAGHKKSSLPSVSTTALVKNDKRSAITWVVATVILFLTALLVWYSRKRRKAM